MNTEKNNRYLYTEEQIEKALFYLLTHKDFDSISIVDICRIANIHRSSFYAHYDDVNDLMIKLEKKLSGQIKDIFFADGRILLTGESFVTYFEHMKKYRDFYSAYLFHQDAANNGFSFIRETLPEIASGGTSFSNNIPDGKLFYHMTFFGAGLTGITKHWLKSGCRETPEEMAQIISDEYNLTVAKKFYNGEVRPRD
ncbi:MAG: TetR/AcrR family transcriptional regulator [Christensenellales bacterium]